METNMHDIIKKGRERKRLSRTDLARLINVSPAAITHWESGVREPSGAALIKIIRVLDLVSVFFPEITEKKTAPFPKTFNLEERLVALEEAVFKKQ